MSGQFLDRDLTAVLVHQRSNARGITKKLQQIAIAHASNVKCPLADHLLAVGVEYQQETLNTCMSALSCYQEAVNSRPQTQDSPAELSK